MDATAALIEQLHPRARQRVPLLLQVEASECGLACLAMVAGAHGQQHSMASARALLGAAPRGLTLTHVLQGASALGLNARAVRTDLEGLHALPLPAIAHWELHHFVVIVQVHRKGVRIHDPARGEIDCSWDDVSERFTGIAVELTPGPQFARARHDVPPRLRDVIGTVRGLRPALVHVALLAVVLELTSLLMPLYARLVFDQAIPSGDRGLLGALALAAAALVLLRVLFSALRSWSVAWLGTLAKTQWTQQLFTHLLRLPIRFFMARSLGDLTSRINALHTIQQTLTRQFLETLIDGLAAVLILAILLAYNPVLAVSVTAVVLLAAGMRALVVAPLRRAVNQGLLAEADSISVLMESLRAVTTLKLNNQSDARARSLAQLQVRQSRTELRQRWLEILQEGSGDGLMGLLRVAVIAIAAAQIVAGRGSVGTLVAFLAYADLFATRATALMNRAIEFALLHTHIERLAEITGQAPEDIEGTRPRAPADAGIAIDGLCFRYSERDRWVLRDATVHIADGESVALVGPSGCGKSTLAKLVTGLLDPEQGLIRIGGVPLAELGKRHARELIACVQQNDELLAGTIAQNIALFDPDADSERIRAAAIAAQIDAEIHAMPMRYETLVGDMGAALSGGQKQRLVLARALYRQPKILVLDEATSHLDVACERAVNAAIAALRITRLIIAHRQETIASADRVVAFGHWDDAQFHPPLRQRVPSP